MKPFFALIRKHLHDTRGTLLLPRTTLFALGWLFVFFCLSRFSGRPALPPQSTGGTQIVRESGLNSKDRQRERCHGETVRYHLSCLS